MTKRGGLHGAYLRSELIEAIGRHRVNSLISTGTLRSLWPRVLVENQRLLDPLTLASAALLSHGPYSVITGPTAARLHGCHAIDSACTHVSVPYGHASRSRAGLKVHSGPTPLRDAMDIAGLRVHSLDRVVTDLLCTARARDALAVTDQALAVQPAECRDGFRQAIARRLDCRRDRRGTNRAGRLLGLATGRAESPPESWLLLEVVDLGFAAPEANWPIYSSDGTLLYRLDLAWPQLRIALEYNGYAVHAGRESQDFARADDLRRRGWLIIDVGADDFRDNRRLERELHEAYLSRGASPGYRVPA